MENIKKFLEAVLYAREESIRRTGRTTSIIERMGEDDVYVVWNYVQESELSKKFPGKTIIASQDKSQLTKRLRFKYVKNIYYDSEWELQTALRHIKELQTF